MRRDPTGQTEWIDESGSTYDAVGGFGRKLFEAQWPSLKNRILDHIDKAHFVPVDAAHFTPSQARRVVGFVESLENPSVFVVGR